MTKKVKKQPKSTPRRQLKRLSTLNLMEVMLENLEVRVKALEQLNNTIKVNINGKETSS